MMKKHMLALMGSVALAMSTAPAAAQGFKPSTLVTHPLRGGAYWLGGGRANAGFIVGKTSVIVIDTQITPADAKTSLESIAKVTNKPVKTVIVSHGDPDHIGGLAGYPADADVIEHEATVSYALAAATDTRPAAGMFGPLYKGVVARKLSRTIGATETMTIDGVKLTLMHIAPAHTAGDIIVYLPAQKIVYAADVLLTERRLPVIHLGGTSLGWIATMKAMLALDADTYIPGHGEVESKAKLKARLADVEAVRAQIKTMVEQGKPLEEIEKAIAEPPSPFLSFAETVYLELTTGYPKATPPWDNMVHTMH